MVEITIKFQSGMRYTFQRSPEVAFEIINILNPEVAPDKEAFLRALCDDRVKIIPPRKEK